MNTTRFLFAAAALLTAVASPLYAQTDVRSAGDRVNLRAQAVANADVVGQVNYGDPLVAYEIGEEWVQIAPPASVDLWVFKAHLDPEHAVNVNELNVRAGPSINYNIVDTLPRGTVVEPRGEVAEWLRIAPPDTARIYISRDYVELPADAAPAGGETAAAESAATGPAAPLPPDAAGQPPQTPAGQAAVDADAEAPPPAAAASDLPTPIVSPSVPTRDTSRRDIPVPPPADLKLIPLEGQGRLAEFVGDLRAAPLINEAPARYRVVRWQNNRWQILCHVYGAASKFRNLQDKRVRIRGREYWIQGAAAPVLIPDLIQEAPAPAE